MDGEKRRMRLKQNLWFWIAMHVPSTLVYWCGIRLGVWATTGLFSATIVSEISLTEALDRWDWTHGKPSSCPRKVHNEAK